MYKLVEPLIKVVAVKVVKLEAPLEVIEFTDGLAVKLTVGAVEVPPVVIFAPP